MNLADYCRLRYLSDDKDWLEGTRQSYQSQIENHIAPALGEEELASLTEKKIKEFYDRLRKEGLSERSVWCIHLLLRRILREACYDGLLDWNPIEDVRIKPLAHVVTTPLSKRQIHKYLEKAKEYHAYPVLYTGLASGLRQGQLITLPWTAFDSAHKRLILPRRWVKLSDRTMEILLDEYEKHGESRTIFVDSRDGAPYKMPRLYYLHCRILDSAQLPHIGYRDMQKGTGRDAL